MTATPARAYRAVVAGEGRRGSTVAHLLQYHNEALEGRCDPPYGRGPCSIVTANPEKFTADDVVSHTCWRVVGRKVPGGHIYFLGSRFTVRQFYEDPSLCEPYTHRAEGARRVLFDPTRGGVVRPALSEKAASESWISVLSECGIAAEFPAGCSGRTSEARR